MKMLLKQLMIALLVTGSLIASDQENYDTQAEGYSFLEELDKCCGRPNPATAPNPKPVPAKPALAVSQAQSQAQPLSTESPVQQAVGEQATTKSAQEECTQAQEIDDKCCGGGMNRPRPAAQLQPAPQPKPEEAPVPQADQNIAKGSISRTETSFCDGSQVYCIILEEADAVPLLLEELINDTRACGSCKPRPRDTAEQEVTRQAESKTMRIKSSLLQLCKDLMHSIQEMEGAAKIGRLLKVKRLLSDALGQVRGMNMIKSIRSAEASLCNKSQIYCIIFEEEVDDADLLPLEELNDTKSRLRDMAEQEVTRRAESRVTLIKASLVQVCKDLMQSIQEMSGPERMGRLLKVRRLLSDALEQVRGMSMVKAARPAETENFVSCSCNPNEVKVLLQNIQTSNGIILGLLATLLSVVE